MPVDIEIALRAACDSNEFETVRRSLNDERIKNNPELLFQVLSKAADDNQVELVRLLLEHNEVRAIAAARDNVVLREARSRGHDDIVNLLRQIPAVRTEDTPLTKYLIAFNKKLEAEIRQVMNEVVSPTRKKYPTLFTLYERHNGLCDLMCNYFTLMKVGKDTDPNAVLHRVFNETEHFGLENIDRLAKTHILSIATFFEFVKYLFIGEVPHSIFTVGEQKTLRGPTREFNRTILSSKLDSLPPQSYIKFTMYHSTAMGLPGTGHSMLITKTDTDMYMFFNPDQREPSCKFYTKDELISHLNELSRDYENVAFVDNAQFMARVDRQLQEQLKDPPAPAETSTPEVEATRRFRAEVLSNAIVPDDSEAPPETAP